MHTFKRGWRAFVAWYRKRPFIGGVLTVLGGVEMFFSGQLELGNLKVQVGIEGFQATLIPIVLVLVGVLATLMPQHRIFYGVIALVVAVYSLVGVNLGGFFAGMILGAVGGVMIVSWMPRAAAENPAPSDAADASEAADLVDVAPDASASGRRRAGSARRRAAGGALAVALTVATASGMVALQPQRASAAEPAGACVLGFLGDCSSPSPSPTPSDSSSPTPSDTSSATPSPGDDAGQSAGGSGDSSGGNVAAAPVPAGPTLLAPADDAPVFSGIPALLQGSSLTFNGLRYLGLATVRLADGSTAKVLKLSMNSNELGGFNLDVRDADGKGVDTVATSMSFSGGVNVYLASLQGVLANGDRITYDISHPPSSDGSVPVVRILSLEVFGITGGSSVLAGFHESIS